MIIGDLIENEDGSGILQIELDKEEINLLMSYAVTKILGERIYEAQCCLPSEGSDEDKKKAVEGFSEGE